MHPVPEVGANLGFDFLVCATGQDSPVTTPGLGLLALALMTGELGASQSSQPPVSGVRRIILGFVPQKHYSQECHSAPCSEATKGTEELEMF